jgi:hypothetical protein
LLYLAGLAGAALIGYQKVPRPRQCARAGAGPVLRGFVPLGHRLLLAWLGYQVPVEVLKVRLASPPNDAHPVATAPPAPGQFASDRVAFGFGRGAKD